MHDARLPFSFQGAYLQHASQNGRDGNRSCLGAQTQLANAPEPRVGQPLETGKFAFREPALGSNDNNNAPSRTNMFRIDVALLTVGIADDNKRTGNLKRIQRCGSFDHRQERIAGLRHGGDGLGLKSISR